MVIEKQSSSADIYIQLNQEGLLLMLTGAFLQSTVEYCTKKNKMLQDSRIQDYNLGLKILHIQF